MGSKKLKIVLYKKRVRRHTIKYASKKLSYSYLLNRSSFFFNKFKKRFFSIHFFFLKKMSILFKNLFFYKFFYKFFFLKIFKNLYGNVYKFLSNYQINLEDNIFYFNSNNRTKKYLQYLNNFSSKNFISWVSEPVFINDENSPFFFKGSIFDNLNPYNFSFAKTNEFINFNFFFLFDFNFFIFLEIYKIHIYLILSKINKNIK